MLVVSSDHEGFPNVVLEAMAARLPVVTTPAGDAGVVVRDCVTGYVVPFNDTEAMASRMVQLAKSADLRRRFGAGGREQVEQHYSFENLADRILSIYRDIAAQQGKQKVLSILNGSCGIEYNEVDKQWCKTTGQS
jgi:glycosyltransferase involved in cell wall biosynthesis